MADPDVSSSVDIDAIGPAMATEAFPAAACREIYHQHFAGVDVRRDLENVGRAFMASQGGRTAYKPELIRLMSCLHDGAFSTEKVWRLMRGFGEVGVWGLGMFDITVSPLAQLAEQLAKQAADPDAMIRDLMSWVELGDDAALDRITPVVIATGKLALREFGRTREVGSRLCDVLALRFTNLDDKLDALLAHAEELIVEGALLGSLEPWLTRHVGRRRVPAIEISATNDSDRAHVRAMFVVFWRLATDHRALFDAHAARLFTRFSWRDAAMLRKLGIVDDERTIPKAGRSGKPWRILRAGRLVFVASGNYIDNLPRLAVTIHATEAKARADVAAKIASKRKAS